MAKVTYLGHAQHFICADKCRYRLGSLVKGEVGRYIVSTVGEYMIGGEMRPIGADRLYGTYVFRADEGDQDCGCPNVADWGEIDSLSANTAKEAFENHTAMIVKWSRIADGE
jgi:hypothetical protein